MGRIILQVYNYVNYNRLSVTLALRVAAAASYAVGRLYLADERMAKWQRRYHESIAGVFAGRLYWHESLFRR
jgi:hypothetical protein